MAKKPYHRRLCALLYAAVGRLVAAQLVLGVKEYVVSLVGVRSAVGRGPGGRGWSTITLFVAVMTLLAGCAGDDDSITIPTSTTRRQPSATTTTSRDAVDTEVIDRYKQFWETRFQANQAPPNPDLPALREYATGDQLDNVVAETRRNLQQGLALRRPDKSVARSVVRVVTIGGDVATLQECVVDDGVVYRYKTGEVVNAAVATHSVEATMSKVGGAWKLAAARLVQRWEGVAGCALSAES